MSADSCSSRVKVVMIIQRDNGSQKEQEALRIQLQYRGEEKHKEWIHE